MWSRETLRAIAALAAILLVIVLCAGVFVLVGASVRCVYRMLLH